MLQDFINNNKGKSFKPITYNMFQINNTNLILINIKNNYKTFHI